MIESISTKSENITVLDQRIEDQIKKDHFSSWSSISTQNFRKCFLYGANRTMEILLTEGWNEMADIWGQNFANVEGDYQNVLVDQNFNANEKIVVKILEICKSDVSLALKAVKEETQENMLHIFLRKKMVDAALLLLREYEATDLLFCQSSIGDLPLTLAIANAKLDNDEGSALPLKIWERMVNSNRISDISNVIRNVNRNGQNILHVCCEGKQHELLTKICLSSNLNAEIIEETINKTNLNGWTPFDVCKDEFVVSNLMEKLQNFDVKHIDNKNNNILHIYAKKDFTSCVRKIMLTILEEEKWRQLLIQQNKDGNNPLMACV